MISSINRLLQDALGSRGYELLRGRRAKVSRLIVKRVLKLEALVHGNVLLEVLYHLNLLLVLLYQLLPSRLVVRK